MSRWARLAPAALYAAGIAWASHQPNPFPALPTALLSHDKLLHAAAYAGLAWLLAWGLRRAGLEPRRSAGLAVAVAALYGLTDELHQAFVPGRSADVLDWVADAAGALTAAALPFLRRWGVRASIRR